ncbi:MAG: RluA family pseudouridine synthase [Deltaproteobacteria bacterium]|nr:RluA family pseudouridine synthase [Deltaproteobacteria bacterium]
MAEGIEGPIVFEFRVPNELEGQRLDRFLEWRIPRLSRERAQAIIRACARNADGSTRHPWERVRAGEKVVLVRERFLEPEAPRHFELLYQDEVLVVVEKPPGLPVHPSPTYRRNTLSYLLDERFGPGAFRITHRLDKETSGLVVCARPGPAEVAMKRQFQERKVQKEYLAIVRGLVQADRFTIDLPLGRSRGPLHMCMEVNPQGDEAVTEVEVIERKGNRSLLRLRPRTGRQHQLRVHLSAIGHPILGDKLYGPGGAELFLAWLSQGMTPEIQAALGHARQALHAASIAFEHPLSGEKMRFHSRLPPDLVKLWEEG